MTKAGSIVFQLNSSDFETKGKTDRLMTFYKQLLRTRRLSRFCKEAFIEKADRQLNGLEEQYTQLHSYINSKGIDYILEAIREKETRPSPPMIDEAEINKAVQLIIQALMKGIQNELRFPDPDPDADSTEASHIPEPLPKPQPDLVKLMALL